MLIFDNKCSLAETMVFTTKALQSLLFIWFTLTFHQQWTVLFPFIRSFRLCVYTV